MLKEKLNTYLAAYLPPFHDTFPPPTPIPLKMKRIDLWEIYQFQIHQPPPLSIFLKGYILLMPWLFVIDCLI